MSGKFRFVQSGSTFGQPVANLLAAPIVGPTGPRGQTGISTGRLFYLNYSLTGSETGYSQLSSLPTLSSGAMVQTTVSPMLYDIISPPYITNVGEPDSEFIPNGIWSLQLFASCTGSIRLFADIITYHYTGLSEVIATTPEVVVNSPDPTMYTLQTVIPYQNIHRDDRIGVTLRCLNDTLQTQTLQMYYEGNYYSYLNTPFSSYEIGPTGPQGFQGDIGPQGIMGPEYPEWTLAQTSTFTGGCITHLDSFNSWHSTGPTDIWEINNFDRFGNHQRQLFQDMQNALQQSSNVYFSLSNMAQVYPFYLDDVAQYKLVDLYQGTAAYYLAGEIINVSGSPYIGTGSNLRLHLYSVGVTGPVGETGAQGPQGNVGMGFQIFSSVNSYDELCSSNPTHDNIGEFVLVTGGELFVYMGTGLGSTGPTGCVNSWNYAGDVTDETKLMGSTGPQGIAGLQGATGPVGLNGQTGSQGATGVIGPTGPAGTSGNAVWFSTGTNAIFYTGASVGIRTSTPQTALDVNGDITCRGQVINPIFKGYKETINIATSAGTFDINWSTGNNHSIILANSTNIITFSGIAATGTLHSINVFFQQGSSGNSTISWPANLSWGSVGAPTLSTTANVVDIINFISFKGTSRIYAFLAGKNFAA